MIGRYGEVDRCIRTDSDSNDQPVYNGHSPRGFMILPLNLMCIGFSSIQLLIVMLRFTFIL